MNGDPVGGPETARPALPPDSAGARPEVAGLPSALVDSLCCPKCRSRFLPVGDGLQCADSACAIRFPIIGGVPVLLNEENSAFRIADYLEAASPKAGSPPGRPSFKKTLGRALRWSPSLSNNLTSQESLRRFRGLVVERASAPAVLVLGGQTITVGTDVLLEPPVVLVESDIAFGPRTKVIIDGHDIPFRDGTFDGIIMQAMLEHVADPYRVVAEAWRVLKPGGLVYASVPFMQQVHAGPYDFTRFTDVGLRRLFRNFEQIERGAFAGSGVALGWALRHYCLNWSESRAGRALLMLIAGCLGFWLKYTDYLLRHKRGIYDCASGYDFLGRKSARTLTDREIIREYRGCIHPG